jgi:hypothetical protein
MRARRDMAMARPELRGSNDFYFDATASLPADKRHCQAKAGDSHGAYKLPFPVYRLDGVWFNANFNKPLEVAIVKWRYV